MTKRGKTFKLITAPSAALMNRFRYAGKFGLLGVVVALVISLLVWQIIVERNREITAVEHERIGLQYLETVRPAWFAIQRHRTLSAALANGDNTVSGQLLTEEGEIDKQFARVTQMINKQAVLATLGERWQREVSAWEGVKKDVQTLAAAQGFERHTRYLEMLDAHMRAAAAQTSLSLDPTLGRNLLISIAVNELPTFIESATKHHDAQAYLRSGDGRAAGADGAGQAGAKSAYGKNQIRNTPAP
jgi:hypothetical protein